MLKQQQFLCVSSGSIWLVTLVNPHEHGRFPKILCTAPSTGRTATRSLPAPKSIQWCIPFLTGVSLSVSVLVTLVTPDWPL